MSLQRKVNKLTQSNEYFSKFKLKAEIECERIGGGRMKHNCGESLKAYTLGVHMSMHACVGVRMWMGVRKC